MNSGSPVRGAFFAAILLLGLLPTGRAQTYQGRELVQASLVADVSAVIPGKPFTVGLLLKMAPHWHTYWRFSGDAGLPTEIKWNLSPGWKAGEIQWPIPFRLIDPGDIETYGYENEVMLLQEITPPSSLPDSSVKLSAEANWLVCEKLCIPGSATLQVELPVSDKNGPANEDLFARYRRLLPQKWPEGRVASAIWNRSGKEMQLTVESGALANYPVVEFFPLPDANTVVGHPKIDRSAPGKLTFRVPIEGDPKLSSLNGLVVFGQTAHSAERNGWTLPADVQMQSKATESLWKFLLFGFLGGFILNLMPCVLPVISLKIFGFIQHAGQDRRRILRSGLAFIAGIFAWFIGLALLLIVLKSAGREITWAFQFTNPYFVLFM
ncbi:MAG: protein-disulfide reductase DsbD domain-containing protein, partial [Chthoniobacterales bacterium]